MSGQPQRIQRKRTKGWRMPEGAVYVGRPTRWGNPFIVHAAEILMHPGTGRSWWCPEGARGVAADMYRNSIRRDSALGFYYLEVEGMEARHMPLTPLAGHDLACWCPLDQPCHADVLLEVANR